MKNFRLHPHFKRHLIRVCAFDEQIRTSVPILAENLGFLLKALKINALRNLFCQNSKVIHNLCEEL